MIDNKKIQSAIRILKFAEKETAQFNEPVEIAYSGGKDSDVLLQLAKESGINYRAIYKNTTIDPPGTIQHVRQNNVEILQPKTSFLELVAKKGFPNRFRRFCCASLKEYKVLNVCASGVRAAESVKRAKRYTTFEACRVYSKKVRIHQFFPIFDWTLTDITKFIEDRKIKLADVYYNNGVIDCKKRLGCMACPLKSDNGIADMKANKSILHALIRAGKKYINNHPQRNFANVYEMFYANYFSMQSYFMLKEKNLFNIEYDFKKLLENYFNDILP